MWVFTYDGIEVEALENIYKPGEDTILILDNIPNIIDDSHSIYIDFGCGSGVLALYIAYHSVYTLAMDIDFSATNWTFYNALSNNVDGYIDIICTDNYLNVIRPDLSICVVSNPPYLPVDRGGFEDISWAGGRGGLDIVFELLECLLRFRYFKLYIVLSTSSDLGEFRRFCEDIGLYISELDRIDFDWDSIILFNVFNE